MWRGVQPAVRGGELLGCSHGYLLNIKMGGTSLGSVGPGAVEEAIAPFLGVQLAASLLVLALLESGGSCGVRWFGEVREWAGGGVFLKDFVRRAG